MVRNNFRSAWVVGAALLCVAGAGQSGCFPFSHEGYEAAGAEGSTSSTMTISSGGGGVGGSTSTSMSAGGNGGAGGSIGCTCFPAVAGATYYQLSQVAGTCPSGTPVTTLRDCDACSCEPACALQGNFDDDASCSGNGFLQFNGSTACLDSTNAGAPVYLEATVAAVCAVPTDVPPLSACQLDPPAACDNGGGVCLPQGEPVCVVVNDGDPCPTGFDDTTHPIQDGGFCGCDCTASGSCPMQARVYSDDNCAQGEKIVAANNTCALATDAVLTVVGSIRPPDPPAAVTCQATNAPMNGTAKTLCCAANP